MPSTYDPETRAAHTVSDRWNIRVTTSTRRGFGTVVVRDLWIAEPNVDIVFHSGKVALSEIDRVSAETVGEYRRR